MLFACITFLLFDLLMKSVNSNSFAIASRTIEYRLLIMVSSCTNICAYLKYQYVSKIRHVCLYRVKIALNFIHKSLMYIVFNTVNTILKIRSYLQLRRRTFHWKTDQVIWSNAKLSR